MDWFEKPTVLKWTLSKAKSLFTPMIRFSLKKAIGHRKELFGKEPMLVCKRYCSYDLTVGNAEVSFLYEGRETTETLKCKSSRSIGEYEYIIGVIWVVANSSNVRLVSWLTTFWVQLPDYPQIST